MQFMKLYNLIFFILFLMFFIVGIGGCKTQNASNNLANNSFQENTIKTPADKQIKAAKELVKKNPKAAANHVKLAAAILKKVRETGNYELNRQAEKSIEKALEIDSKNFVARFLKIQIYLSEHEFQKALDLAEKLEKDNPNSEVLLAAITDAKTELGQYEEAVKSAQRFVDFRPNANSYARVANLRSLYGDMEGAIEARKNALRMADPEDKEILAWHHSQLGKEYFNIGRFSEAEEQFNTALKIFPDYHWALDGKGRVRAAQNDFKTAAQIFEKLNKRTSETERAIFLGDVYKKLGKETEAKKVYDAIVKKQKENKGDMHRIALYWADHNLNLDEALKIAQDDRKENGDLLASDTLAWCLYKKGKFSEAQKYIKEAMRLKTKNALFYYHAGMIEKELNNNAEAVRYLKLALSTNPSFDLLQSEVAKETLATLESKIS